MPSRSSSRPAPAHAYLEVPGEKEYTGKGISYCATCDGFFFRGKDVLVVGGGDSAAEEAIFLTRYASRVRILHRRDKLRASKILQERVLSNEKIEMVWNTVITEIEGENGHVTGVRTRDTVTGAEGPPGDRRRLYLRRPPAQQRLVSGQA